MRRDSSSVPGIRRTRAPMAVVLRSSVRVEVELPAMLDLGHGARDIWHGASDPAPPTSPCSARSAPQLSEGGLCLIVEFHLAIAIGHSIGKPVLDPPNDRAAR